MRLNEIESHIEEKIFKRGLEYYENGLVSDLENDGDYWTASVAGSEDYSVDVTLSDGEIAGSSCDCPYEYGEYCKHQVAVFLAIRDALQKEQKKGCKAKTAVKTTRKPAKPALEELLQRADKSALIAILTELAEEDRVIKNKLLMLFSDKSDSAENARKLIRSAVKSVAYRGFVEYGDVRKAITGAESVLKTAKSLLEGGSYLACAELCAIAAGEMTDLASNSDDSNGYAGGMVSEATGLLSAVTEAIPGNHPDADKLFRLIMKHAADKVYDGWTDWRMELLEACVPLCGNPARREDFESFFMRMRMDGGSEWNRRYISDETKRIALGLISRFDGPERAEEFIERNLDNPDFRKAAIELAFKRGDPSRALTLCIEGEAADADYRGLTSIWKKYRYEAYAALSDTSGQKKLAEEFIKGGDFEYYPKLKALYVESEWPPVMSQLINELKTNPGGVYVQILIHEGLKPLLLALCKERPAFLPELYPHLPPEYGAEVNELFRRLIADMSEQASGRSAYKGVCGVMKHYKKACGEAKAAALKLLLMERYPRRPAFMDELRKL